jgi:hypothetical protein
MHAGAEGGELGAGRIRIRTARHGADGVPRDETQAPLRPTAANSVAAAAAMPPVRAPAVAAAKPALVRRPRAVGRERAFLVTAALFVVAALVVARARIFAAGSDPGYWIGVAGGLAMVLLFLYPLRKRWRAMREFGSTRFWFSLHMTLGIAGPVLIIVHSTLRFGSLNATFAFAAMALVAGSGVVGRFLYARIHHGLYGRRASLAELRARTGLASSEARSRLAFAPDVERRLNEFARRAEDTGNTGLVHPWRFFALGLHALVARRRCTAEATRALKELAAAEHWRADKLERRTSRCRALIAAHLDAVQRVAQLGVFERLFSIWHVAHVPLVYMLVLSAIAHVVAVHMY